MSKKRIFVFCRFYVAGDFKENLSVVGDDYEFRYLVDGEAPGTRDTRARFYAAIGLGETSPELSAEDLDQVVTRCRLLRNIPRAKAERMAHAMALAIGEEMDDFAPDAALGHMVDDYALHLCALLAEKRGIRFCAYSYSYFPERAQLTQGWNGTPFFAREAEESEVDAVLEKIGQKLFRQDYKQVRADTFAKHARMVVRHYAKRLVFGWRARQQNDPLNSHYGQQPFLADRKKLSDAYRRSDFASDWEKDLARLQAEKPGKPVLYLPLGFFPEATSDYWIANRKIIDYDNTIVEAVRQLSRDAVVLVKEHSHMVGMRGRSLYQRLAAIDGAVSIDPFAWSNVVLEAADAVVIGGGSIGVEATIRGKPVFSFGTNSYWFKAGGAFPLDLDRPQDWAAHIERSLAEHVPLDEAGVRKFVRQCLSATARRREFTSLWPLLIEEDLRALLDAA